MKEMNSDLQLWVAFQKGDDIALHKIFKKYYALLHSFGVKMTGNSQLVEDCLQDFFLYLCEKRGQFMNVRFVRGYLFKSFRRRLWKRNKNSGQLEIDHIHGPFEVSPEEVHVQKHHARNQAEVVARLMNNLPPRQREVLYLRYYNGLSIEEISQVLSITYRGVVNTLYKALKKLREQKDSIPLLEYGIMAFMLQFSIF